MYNKQIKDRRKKKKYDAKTEFSIVTLGIDGNISTYTDRDGYLYCGFSLRAAQITVENGLAIIMDLPGGFYELSDVKARISSE